MRGDDEADTRGGFELMYENGETQKQLVEKKDWLNNLLAVQVEA